MKVIAGLAKGKQLKFPKNSKGKRIRPLTSAAKEALFNILAPRISGSFFLDLFAGTGAVGIEALSRGAELAIFVELERKIADTIRQNLEITGFSDKAEIYNLDALKAIQLIDRNKGKFNIIFIGAPYGSSILEKALAGISVSQIVGQDGIVIAEHRSRDPVKDSYGGLIKYRDARYGDTMFSFYSLAGVK